MRSDQRSAHESSPECRQEENFFSAIAATSAYLERIETPGSRPGVAASSEGSFMARDIKAGPKAAPKSKGPPLPVVLSANDLLDGDVVFLAAGGGWTRDPAEARVAHEREEADAMEAEAARETGANRIVDAYLVPVRVEPNGMAVALHFREAIRQKGPTVHPDFGKAALFKNEYPA
jgi:hypothetical protein